MVLVNPPAEVRDEPGVSVLRGGGLPLKSRTMRGVMLGKGSAAMPMDREAARVALPGLRVVGQGPDPAPERDRSDGHRGRVLGGHPRR